MEDDGAILKYYQTGLRKCQLIWNGTNLVYDSALFQPSKTALMEEQETNKEKKKEKKRKHNINTKLLLLTVIKKTHHSYAE